MYNCFSCLFVPLLSMFFNHSLKGKSFAKDELILTRASFFPADSEVLPHCLDFESTRCGFLKHFATFPLSLADVKAVSGLPSMATASPEPVSSF